MLFLLVGKGKNDASDTFAYFQGPLQKYVCSQYIVYLFPVRPARVETPAVPWGARRDMNPAEKRSISTVRETCREEFLLLS